MEAAGEVDAAALLYTLAPVLIVDDDPAACALIASVLQLGGYRTEAVGDAEEALHHLRTRSYGAVVLDVRLPGRDGIGLLTELRADPATATLPVLVLTADDEVAARVRGLRAGATDYIVKPFEPDELLARLEAHLRSHSRWTALVQTLLEQRASVVRAMSGVGAASEPDEIAANICAAAADLVYVAGASLIGFFGTSASRTLGATRGAFDPGPDSHWAVRARAQAVTGGWIEPDGPDGPLACAPVRFGAVPHGVLVLRLASTGVGVGVVTDQGLAAAIDFASIAATLLGLRERDPSTRSRQRRDVLDVLAHRAYAPVFQPVVSLDDRRVVGWEALTRFRDGTPPDQRFAAAALVDLGPDLELATMEAAVRAARHVPEGSFVSFNVSPSLVVERHNDVRRVLRGADVPVILELTEHDAVDDYEALHDALISLDPPVRVSVDDAGAGFASLRHVVMLEPDYIKLDRSWIAGIDGDQPRQALVAGLSYFARATNATLVAEGVETEPEFACVIELDVELGQGYLFGRPAPLAV